MLGGLGAASGPQQPILATALRALSLADLVHQLQGIEEGVWHGNGPVAKLTALLERPKSKGLGGEVHPVGSELQCLGDSAAGVGHDHAEGADLAPVVLGGGPQEALALLSGEIFAFSVKSEQFIRHLFTFTWNSISSKVHF